MVNVIAAYFPPLPDTVGTTIGECHSDSSGGDFLQLLLHTLTSLQPCA